LLCRRPIRTASSSTNSSNAGQAVKVIATNAGAFTATARAMATARGIKLLAREDLAALLDQYNPAWGEVRWKLQ